MLAALRVQTQINGGPQKKSDLRIWPGGLAISWDIGLFGGKATSNPDGIVMGWPDLMRAQVSGLPKAEYANSAPFARLTITEGKPLILLFSEKHGLLSLKPTFSNDPAAFIDTVRAITAGLMADSMRRFEANLAAKKEETRAQAELGSAIERARRYVNYGRYMAAVKCNLVLSGGELPGYAVLFGGQLCFFDHADIDAEDISDGNPIINDLYYADSCEVQAPEGIKLNGQGIPRYAESVSANSDFHVQMPFAVGQNLNLRVPYASLSPAQQQGCVKSLNGFLKAFADAIDNDD